MEVTGQLRFGCAIPFPKHSHTTTLFQSSLSRNTSHGAVFRAGCLNQLIFFFSSVLDSESNLPSCAFSSHIHTAFPAGLVHGNLRWVVTSRMRQRFAPMPAAKRAACLQCAQLWQLGGYQGICKPERRTVGTLQGKCFWHAHAYAAGIKIRFHFPLCVKRSKSSFAS